MAFCLGFRTHPTLTLCLPPCGGCHLGTYHPRTHSKIFQQLKEETPESKYRSSVIQCSGVQSQTRPLSWDWNPDDHILQRTSCSLLTGWGLNRTTMYEYTPIMFTQATLVKNSRKITSPKRGGGAVRWGKKQTVGTAHLLSAHKEERLALRECPGPSRPIFWWGYSLGWVRWGEEPSEGPTIAQLR